jgi:hypothetical protein
MDALSDVLRVAHLTGGVFMHADFFAPWCMAARVSPEHCAPAIGPASHLIVYHYVVEGAFRIRLDGESGEGTAIGAGEVVLLPRKWAATSIFPPLRAVTLSGRAKTAGFLRSITVEKAIERS